MARLLEWEERPVRARAAHCALASGLEYMVAPNSTCKPYTAWHAYRGQDHIEAFDTLEEAKAACEADFARRLMEVPAVRELVEAGREISMNLAALNAVCSAPNVSAQMVDDACEDVGDSMPRLDKALGVFGDAK